MDVILLEKIDRLGTLGQVVKVRDGFARNFLLPTGKALRATKDNLAYFEAEKAAIEAANAKRRDAAKTQSSKLENAQVVIIRQASETGQLYGSVAARDVAEALEAATKLEIGRSQVVLNQPLKNLGVFDVVVAMHADVKVTVSVNIARTQDEAAIQKKTGKAVVRKDGEDVAPAAKSPSKQQAEAETEASEAA